MVCHNTTDCPGSCCEDFPNMLIAFSCTRALSAFSSKSRIFALRLPPHICSTPSRLSLNLELLRFPCPSLVPRSPSDCLLHAPLNPAQQLCVGCIFPPRCLRARRCRLTTASFGSQSRPSCGRACSTSTRPSAPSRSAPTRTVREPQEERRGI
eukprot:6211037-Pleurochrysis_carterae.AAC.2